MMQQHNAWRPQRGLPERAVSVLRAWLFEHFLHPYPKVIGTQRILINKCLPNRQDLLEARMQHLCTGRADVVQRLPAASAPARCLCPLPLPVVCCPLPLPLPSAAAFAVAARFCC